MNTELSYVILCDLLGFTNMVMRLRDDRAGMNALLRRFNRASTRAMAHISERGEQYKVFRRNKHFKIFSDNLVIAYPFEFDRLMDEANYGLISQAAAFYQFEMALQGFFVRGGFTIGESYMNANMVFGDAIIEAYRIETKLAVYPRIVLSPPLKQIVQHHLHAYGRNRNQLWQSPHQRYLLCDDDGNLFINYLGTAILGEYDEPYADWDRIRKHRDQINENLLRFRNIPRVYEKYKWLAGYHNYYCRRVLSTLTGFDRDILVPNIRARRDLHLVAEAIDPVPIPQLIPG